MQALWRIVWRVLKKLKVEFPYDLVIPLLGILSGKDENQFRKIHAPNVHSSGVYNSQNMEPT